MPLDATRQTLLSFLNSNQFYKNPISILFQNRKGGNSMEMLLFASCLLLVVFIGECVDGIVRCTMEPIS